MSQIRSDELADNSLIIERCVNCPIVQPTWATNMAINVNTNNRGWFSLSLWENDYNDDDDDENIFWFFSPKFQFWIFFSHWFLFTVSNKIHGAMGKWSKIMVKKLTIIFAI